MMPTLSGEAIALIAVGALVAAVAFLVARAFPVIENTDAPAAVPATPRPGAVLGAIAIVAGLAAAAIGFGAWFLIDPRGDPVLAIVAVLWVACGLIGLLIAAAGAGIMIIENAILAGSERGRSDRIAAEPRAHRVGDQPPVILE